MINNRNYLLFTTGLFVSRVGTFMQNVAVIWHLYQLTKSPISLGLLGVFTFLPVLLTAFFSGIASDIFNRKKIIFLVQFLTAIVYFVMTFLTVKDLINPWLIYLLVALNWGLYSFEAPARQSMLPTLVDKKVFPRAVSTNNTVVQVASFIGPALGGFFIAFVGVQSVYIIYALTLLFSMATIVAMSPAVRNVVRPEFNLRGIKEGLAFVFRSPLIYGSMIIDFLASFFASAVTLMPIFAVDILKVGPLQMGFLYAAPSLGAIVSGLILTFFFKIKNQGRMLIYAVILYGASTFLFALSRNYYLSLFFIAITGASDMVSVIIRNIIRQLNTPDHLRGRMTAISMIFYNGGPQLGEIEAGFAAYLLGTPTSVALGGLATIAITLLVAKKNPKLLNYKNID